MWTNDCSLTDKWIYRIEQHNNLYTRARGDSNSKRVGVKTLSRPPYIITYNFVSSGNFFRVIAGAKRVLGIT